MDIASVVQSRDAVARYAQARDFAGSDPYDGLSGWPARFARSTKTRQLLTQIFKRAPNGFRWLAGVRPVRMSKALALFISGYHQMGADEALIRGLSEQLACSRGPHAWGYEFDVQTRWGHYAAGSPNVIATSFAIDALSRAAPDLLPRDALLKWFNDFLLTKQGWFRYVPGNDHLIHNANLLAARSYKQIGGDVDKIKRAMEITLNDQRSDGSWPYGMGSGLDWVDNFHTVYLLLVVRDLQNEVSGAAQALQLGTSFWRERLFDQLGRPRYFADGLVRNDVHNVATALSGLVQLIPRSREFDSTLAMLLSFQATDGGFRSRPSMPSHMRWNNAHAFDALCRVSSAFRDVSGPDS